jgi:putative ABC transport system permease protein
VLVVGELALALVLLGGAGLLLRSMWKAGSVAPGFDAQGVLSARLWLPQPNKLDMGKYFKQEQRVVFFEQLLRKLADSPGVESAGLISSVPLAGDMTRSRMAMIPEGREREGQGEIELVQGRVASADYFRAMRIPMVSGRMFEDTDDGKAPPVALINQTLARHFWPGQDAVGKRFQLPRAREGEAGNQFFTVVGIVADVKTTGLDAETPDEVYTPYRQFVALATGIVIRSAQSNGAAAMIPILRARIAELDPELPIFEVATVEDVLLHAMAARRFLATLLALFALVALSLAALGIYGVMAYAVTQKRREIAVRMALGAKEQDVLNMVIARGMRLVGLGVVVGAAALCAFGRLMASLLFGVTATDGPTFGLIAIVLVLVALVASWLPARRAARTSPMLALRSE